MGNNQAYTQMEQTVIAAYDAGLRGEQLAPFLEPYRGTDIDSGGKRDIKTSDGKDVEDVIIEAFCSPDQQEAWKAWKNGGYSDDLLEAAYDALDSVIGRDGRFDWC